MNRISLKHALLAAVAAISLSALTTQPSYARTTDQGGLRTTMIAGGDRLDSKLVEANATPASGQHDVSVTETLHYVHEPFLWWNHNVAYTIKRTLSATYDDRLGYFVLHDSDGDWYEVNSGSVSASKLPGKPQVVLGMQPAMLNGNDPGSLVSVTAGNVVGGMRQLNATYNYTHTEQLDDVSYTLKVPVNTTFVADQNASFAWVSGSLFSVDASGQVSQLNGKPTADHGMLGGMISASDSTGAYPDVTASGGVFLVTEHHVHEDTFEYVAYTTQAQVLADYVPEVNAYMAWIDGTEYEADPGSSVVDRLSHRPVVQLGTLTNSLPNDRAYRTDVFSVTDTNVVIRFSFLHNESYVAKAYDVERQGVMYYNQTWSVWMVAIDGQSYVVAWGSDTSNDPSVPVLQAPAGSTRPVYAVPSNSGDGLPPALVPGADPHNGSHNVSPAAPSSGGGIPGLAPATQTPPSSGNCIPGLPC